MTINPHWLTDIEHSEIVLQAPLKEDAVTKCTKGWVFWDETWTDAFGYFATEKEARLHCAIYAKNMGLVQSP